ncbi:SDR family oxidoreductase [Afifella sp. IM 167]|uniref:SDR family oxidoreductase n=1 Tax=Afifella sp. IM 167 TaxID=2033586 RepID=UPI0021061689|nr:SDR family oxidoreductase [Afifella sp. IM 167]
MTISLFCFGLGFSARNTIDALQPESVWGTTRSAERLRELADLGAMPLIFDGVPGAPHNGAVEDALAEASHVLVSIAPGEDGDPVLNVFRQALAEAEPMAISYLSTVGVYGDHGGGWVDETTKCNPVSKRSRQRRTAEERWLEFGEEAGIPVSVIRLSGIYGPGRGPFEKLRSGKSRRIIKEGQVFNRIHGADIGTIAAAALTQQAVGIFNGTDDEPAPPQDVIAYAASLLGMEPPPEVRFEEAEMSPMALSFWGENKRVKNDKIKEELGVRLAYPTYREGLAATLAAEKDASGGPIKSHARQKDLGEG